MNCLFCDIVNGKEPAHIVWEDDKHMAFLSIYPNTEGVTVLIPKNHFGSYLFEMPKKDMHEMLDAAKTVAKKLDAAFEDVGRTAMIAEGYGVNHVHIKLFPLHGTVEKEWQQRSSDINTYFEKYRGYVSSHDADRAHEKHLQKIAKTIKKSG